MTAVDVELLTTAAAAMADRASRAEILRALKLREIEMRRDFVALPGPLIALRSRLMMLRSGHDGSNRVPPSNAWEHCNITSTEAMAVSVTGASRMVHVSVSTIRRRIRDGSLPSVLFGGCRRILTADVAAMFTKEHQNA